jgi:hypothetical protein
VIVETRDQDGTSPYALVVLNEEGVIAERFLTSHFESESRSYEDDVSPWEFELRELYGRARSSALGIDATINAMLEELNDDPPF